MAAHSSQKRLRKRDSGKLILKVSGAPVRSERKRVQSLKRVAGRLRCTLKDQAGRARILTRIERLIAGNPGAHRKLKHGIAELKIDFGPGYRVYYSQRGNRLLLLLAGGDKATQKKDMDLAIALSKRFEE